MFTSRSAAVRLSRVAGSLPTGDWRIWPVDSVWLARSRAPRIFGSAEQDTYRACARVEISGRSFASQQARLICKADSRLGYLRAALVRTGQADASEAATGQAVPGTPAGGNELTTHDHGNVHQNATQQAAAPQPPERSWRAFLLNVWTVGVGAPLVVAALLAGHSTIMSLIGGKNALLAGSVVCLSGQPVVGVWIAASTGQRDSGYAHLGTANSAAQLPNRADCDLQLLAAERHNLFRARRMRGNGRGLEIKRRLTSAVRPVSNPPLCRSTPGTQR